MILLERPAPRGWEGRIRRAWFLEMPRARRYEKILPLPWIHVIVNLSTPYRLFARDGTPLAVADAFVSGPHDEYLVTELPETVRHVGVELEPDALPTLSALAPADLVRAVRPAAEVIPGIHALATALHEHPRTPDGALDALLAHLASVRRPADPDPVAARTLAALQERPGRAIGDLATQAGVSHRTLIARFRASVGMTPKAYAQLWRFHGLIGELGTDRPAWADLAAQSDYYDQAQVIRAFRRFTGWTPNEYLRRIREHGPDAALFVPLAELPPAADQPARS